MSTAKAKYIIREAREDDFTFVANLMDEALSPYYGGDHRAHAKRIFNTHISGGKDNIGHFSYEQRMFILELNDATPAGMIHIVGKRQGTYKISPIIVAEPYRGNLGLGSTLLDFAEYYARGQDARQIYCTVARENKSALQFFIRNGYYVAGESASHYKLGITEVMLYKPLIDPDFDKIFDRDNISVQPCEEFHESQVRQLLLNTLPNNFGGIDSTWIDSLFNGYKRRHTIDVNQKYKLIYVAVDRDNNVLGVAGATPKKGEPIKVMPFIATTQPAFVALLTDIPFALKPYGHKMYIHITPTVEETIALQQRGWKLDAAMPAAYHNNQITQQWSLDILGEDFMRSMRVKQNFLDLIRKGEKTLEVRVAYDSIKTIQAGERIRLRSRTQEQVILVKDVRQYRTFEEMLSVEEASRITPGLTKGELLNLLKEIYPLDRERLGVVVLDIQTDPSVNR
jgi:ASC-1-like (ASCH) protein/ribosomal protein S18 acetylase RimI-like enzyme